ncbi:longitudinals lacking protein, isoforms H/M/V isoform X17 [Nasonia vitripennis]|uniref:Longitudinals lacking protein n=1 Tax=Nasonia vitripennis TaxID=7425 RepID=A0A7M7R0I7_NASVI|nr:longitudinals lacking protein, isoforms H/M/V isoform X17 [Nasonia vitripennis]
MEDDQQFCLRWNNHQSTIIQNFDTLLESGTLVDCTLAAEGKYLKAHKVVLSACSPYFEGLLSEHYDKHPVFILKDVKFKELKAMMDYMYRGEVNISQDQLTALLKAAESLQIKGLSDSRTDKGTGNTGNTTTGGSKDNTRPAKTASSTAAASASAAAVDIPHTSSGLTIEKNSKVPRQSIQQVSVSDQLENSASPQLRGHSSREGSQSPTRKRKRLRRRSLGNDDNSMENHEASNSSDVNMTAPALGVAPVAEEKSQADPADSIGRSALMQQLTKPADEMLQMPLEKPEPSEDMIQPKSEYQDDQESVEDLTNFDDDMNDLNEMEQDNSRAGPSHDPSQHAGMPSWHIAGDRSNASVVGAAAGPGAGDEVFLAAAEAAQAQRDSQVSSTDIGSPTSQYYLDFEIVKQEEIEPEIDVINFDEDEPSMLTTTDSAVSSSSLSTKSKEVPSPKPAKKSQLKLCKPVSVKLERESDSLIGWLTVVKTEPLHPKTTYKCNNCSQIFQAKLYLRRHLRYCAKFYNYRCPYCDYYQLKFSNDLRDHITKNHRNYKRFCRVSFESSTNTTGDYKNRKSIDSDRFLCPHCPASFLREKRLKAHLKTECRTKIACLWCSKVFKAFSNLSQHCQEVHNKSL